MIVIALGANLPSERAGPPRATLEYALERLCALGVVVAARSRWYETAPVPPSGQPWFVNGVALAETRLGPGALLEVLHTVESELGRVRSPDQNAARAVDLDLIDYDGRVSGPGEWPSLPHPRMHERAFVLAPLAEVAPSWRHPTLGKSAQALLAELLGPQACRPMP